MERAWALEDEWARIMWADRASPSADSLYAAVMGCQVVAWEPVPAFRTILRAGAALNNGTRGRGPNRRPRQRPTAGRGNRLATLIVPIPLSLSDALWRTRAERVSVPTLCALCASQLTVLCVRVPTHCFVRACPKPRACAKLRACSPSNHTRVRPPQCPIGSICAHSSRATAPRRTWK